MTKNTNLKNEKKEFEKAKDSTWNTIIKAQDDFKERMLSQKAEEIYSSASKIAFIESALDELGRNVEELVFETPFFDYSTNESLLFALLILEKIHPITSSSIINLAERYWEKSERGYEYGTEDFSYFLEHYVLTEFNLDSIIEQVKEIIRTKSEVLKENISIIINQAMIDYKSLYLNQGIEEVYDNADQIFFCNNVLEEFLREIDFLNLQDDNYNKMELYLVQLVKEGENEGITSAGVLRAVDNYWKSEENYIPESEDFTRFLKEYIAPEFNLKLSTIKIK
ncbi:hypothetical protein [Lactococcus lactis]|uniref:hypothetical protein n=1 Tax=Lactococcus lactis TaxID=1358 RepID=UPI002891E76A|nr:hypothetical protein [Lactococcus lactis]MDT2909253.1 hypothetical protein [Lactococcus lactis]MDT2925217.1 hypothetical protein [Lactococcus lactis]MDT2952076.1 hypothetical protein [Lactococcus lactis]